MGPFSKTSVFAISSVFLVFSFICMLQPSLTLVGNVKKKKALVASHKIKSSLFLPLRLWPSWAGLVSALRYSQRRTLAEEGPLPLFFSNDHSQERVKTPIVLGLSKFLLQHALRYFWRCELTHRHDNGGQEGSHMPGKEKSQRSWNVLRISITI